MVAWEEWPLAVKETPASFRRTMFRDFLRSLPNTAAALLLASMALNSAAADDWPQRRGPRNDGISAETQWSSNWNADGPPRAWQATVGMGFSGIIVANETVFTMGHADDDQDSVLALEAATGREVWRHSYPEPLNPKMYEGGPNSTPTFADGVIYAASRLGKIHALDAATGTVRWQVDLQVTAGKTKNDWGLSGAPLVVGDRVFLNYGNGATALDRATGKLVWTLGGGDRNSFGSPVMFENQGTPLLLMHMKKELLGVSTVDGKEIFRHRFGKGFETHCADPVLVPNGIFISSGDDGGEVVSVSTKGARRVWKNTNLGTFTGTAVYRDGYLYGLDAGGYKRANQQLRCISVQDGTISWALPGYGQGSLIAAGDRLIVLSDQGELSVVRASPAKGEILASAQVLGGKCWTQPALANGRLYLRNAKGDLVCLRLDS